MNLLKDAKASVLTITTTLFLTGCSPGMDDLADMVTRECPGSMSVKCIAAQAELAVNELQGKLNAAQEDDFREKFVSEHGKDAYRNLVLDIQQELFSAKLLTISRSTVLFYGDTRFSEKHFKYADPDLAVERSKEMVREAMALSKEINEELAGMPDAGISGNLAQMDASELGSQTAIANDDTSQIQGSPGGNPGEAASSEDGSNVGPSFDCAKASTHIEKLICSDKELASLDRRLSEVYAELRSNQESGDYFKQEQKEWLLKTRAACTDSRCLASAYTARLEDMEAARQYLNKPAEFR